MRVHVFLRSPLFSLPVGRHVPDGAAVLLGTLGESSSVGLTLKVDGYLDERGRTLEGEARTLIVPGSKIDHVWVEE